MEATGGSAGLEGDNERERRIRPGGEATTSAAAREEAVSVEGE